MPLTKNQMILNPLVLLGLYYLYGHVLPRIHAVVAEESGANTGSSEIFVFPDQKSC